MTRERKPGGRYVTVTGVRLPDAPATINDRSAEIAAVYYRYWPNREALSPSVVGGGGSSALRLSDEEILSRAFACAKNGAKARQLYGGNWSGLFTSWSQADQSLCNYLAFWFAKDPDAIDRVFRASGLYREEKWNRDSYREPTIANAIASVEGDGYRPPPRLLWNGKPIEEDTVSDPTSAPDQGAATELVITPLANRRVKPVHYLVPGRIPLGKLMLISGRRGSGKSTLTRRFAADLSRGRCAFGLTYDNPVTAKTLILAAEDGIDDTILPGLLAEGADLSMIAILEAVRRGSARHNFTLALQDVELLKARLAKSPDIKNVIIDPIASFVGRSRVDDHRSAELRTVLDPLNALAESTGACVLMIGHFNKTKGDAADRFAGAAAYIDACRAVYGVVEDPEDGNRRLLVPVKQNLPGFGRTSIPFTQDHLPDPEAEALLNRAEFSHLGAEDRAAIRTQLGRVRFDAPRSVDPNEAMKAPKTDASKVEKCKEWLKQFLAQYAYPSDEITAAGKAAGFTFDNVKTAREQLKSEDLHSSNRNTYQGKWWVGFGEQTSWTLRPEPAPHSPNIPFSPSSPFSPNNGNESLFQSRERKERSGQGSDGKAAPLCESPTVEVEI
jgi:archaellum biogenesis ATPase FlaH